MVPSSLGRTESEQVANLVGLLDAYMVSSGFHMNVNVLNRETLEDAMEHPENYPQLTIRVSGYAVNFVRLTREQQVDVLSRTFHGASVIVVTPILAPDPLTLGTTGRGAGRHAR